MFVSQQVKGNLIIIYKKGKYELTEDLPNDITLENLKTPLNYRMVLCVLLKMKILLILARNY